MKGNRWIGAALTLLWITGCAAGGELSTRTEGREPPAAVSEQEEAPAVREEPEEPAPEEPEERTPEERRESGYADPPASLVEGQATAAAGAEEPFLVHFSRVGRGTVYGPFGADGVLYRFYQSNNNGEYKKDYRVFYDRYDEAAGELAADRLLLDDGSSILFLEQMPGGFHLCTRNGYYRYDGKMALLAHWEFSEAVREMAAESKALAPSPSGEALALHDEDGHLYLCRMAGEAEPVRILENPSVSKENPEHSLWMYIPDRFLNEEDIQVRVLGREFVCRYQVVGRDGTVKATVNLLRHFHVFGSTDTQNDGGRLVHNPSVRSWDSPNIITDQLEGYYYGSYETGEVEFLDWLTDPFYNDEMALALCPGASRRFVMALPEYRAPAEAGEGADAGGATSASFPAAANPPSFQQSWNLREPAFTMRIWMPVA